MLSIPEDTGIKHLYPFTFIVWSNLWMCLVDDPFWKHLQAIQGSWWLASECFTTRDAVLVICHLLFSKDFHCPSVGPSNNIDASRHSNAPLAVNPTSTSVVTSSPRAGQKLSPVLSQGNQRNSKNICESLEVVDFTWLHSLHFILYVALFWTICQHQVFLANLLPTQIGREIDHFAHTVTYLWRLITGSVHLWDANNVSQEKVGTVRQSVFRNGGILPAIIQVWLVAQPCFLKKTVVLRSRSNTAAGCKRPSLLLTIVHVHDWNLARVDMYIVA